MQYKLKVRRQKMIAMAKHSVTATASLRHMYGYTVVRHCWLSKSLRQTRNLVYCLMRPRDYRQVNTSLIVFREPR